MKGVVWIIAIAAVLNVDAKPTKQSRVPDCALLPDGTLIPDATLCSSFFECQAGLPTMQTCGPATYFDATTLSCLPDIDNICPQSGCVTDGTIIGSPTDCSRFYICYDGINIEQNCVSEEYFDKTTLSCLPDTENICPQSGCSVDGTIIPHATDCAIFYVCYGNINVEQSCDPGSYFDKTDLACLPDTNNICGQTGCGANGVMSAHPTECNLFYVCYDGSLVEQSCGNGSYFDKINLYCVPDTNNTCSPPTPCSCEGDLTPNPDSCYLYFNCSGGVLVGGNCGNGSYFDSCSKTCQIDTTGDCWPLAPDACTSSCSGGLQENEVKSIPDKCNGYLKCIQGELVEERCQEGEYFDDATKNCIADVNNICCPANG